MTKLAQLTLPAKPTYLPLSLEVDFYALFQAIEPHSDHCFIFESLGEEGKFSRYSIMGFNPKHLISAKGNQLSIDNQQYSVENPYVSLRQLMPPPLLAKNYAGGLVGYLAYEAVNYFEPSLALPEHPLFDQFKFGFYTDGLIFDKQTGELIYFYFDHNRSQFLHQCLRLPRTSKKTHTCFLKDTLTEKEHHVIVEGIKEQIKSGNTFQCEVGFKSEYHIRGNALPIYGRLREVNPSPFMYYLKFGAQKIIGASPELLFSLRGKEMTTRPLAGTIARGQGLREDQKLARALLNDPKEKAEHSMLVDLHRNDLGKVAQFGTVSVQDLMTIKKFSHVQHIASEITALIDPKHDAFTALASNFPMGTVSGAPKIETIKIIAGNEPQPRGPYGGGVGEFSFNGDCTFALALRTLFISDEYGYTQTSSGIVHDSVAANEYMEIQRKLAAIRIVLQTI